MKKTELTSLLAVATLFLVAGSSYANAQPAAGPGGDGPRMKAREQLDLNKDGKIDDTERAAAEVQMRGRLSEKPRFVERADTNKDGQVSDDEWAVAKERMKDHRQKGMNKERMRDGKKHHAKGPEARGPKDDPMFRRGYLMGKYDANNDGKLDETERAAVRTAMEAKKRAGMEKQLARLKSVDVDNDGKISDTEWAAAKEKFKDEHPGMKDRGARKHGQPPPEE